MLKKGDDVYYTYSNGVGTARSSLTSPEAGGGDHGKAAIVDLLGLCCSTSHHNNHTRRGMMMMMMI